MKTRDAGGTQRQDEESWVGDGARCATSLNREETRHASRFIKSWDCCFLHTQHTSLIDQRTPSINHAIADCPRHQKLAFIIRSQ